MAIIIEKGVFTLQTKNSTYQMKADDKGIWHAVHKNESDPCRHDPCPGSPTALYGVGLPVSSYFL